MDKNVTHFIFYGVKVDFQNAILKIRPVFVSCQYGRMHIRYSDVKEPNSANPDKQLKSVDKEINPIVGC